MAVSVGEHPHLNPRDLEHIDFRNEDVNYARRIDGRCSGRSIFPLWSLYHKFGQRCFVLTPSLDHGHPDGYCGWVHCSQMQVL